MEIDSFYTNTLVVNVTSAEEMERFIAICKILGLTNILYVERYYLKDGMDTFLNGGNYSYKQEDLCFEYQLHKGFSFDSKQNYNKDETTIVSVNEFIKIVTVK